MTTVLHLIETSGPGGAERMLISLVEGLDRRRYRSVVCLLKEGWLATEFRRRGVATAVIHQRGGLDPAWIMRCGRLIERDGVDILHAHEFTMNVYGCIGAKMKRRPIITTVHGKNYYPDRWRRRTAYQVVARMSNSMVAVSEDIRRFLIERVRVRPDRLTRIYNGVAREDRAADGRAISRELGLSETARVVGCVANLYPVKGHSCLLEAARRVVDAGQDATFVIAGRGPLQEVLRGQAAALGLSDRVKFVGFRQDISALLQSFDVFALASLSEGMPLSILEAMAAAKPVVATAVGGVPEVVTQGDTGFLVPANDPDQLAGRIVELLRDRALARKLGENGQRRIAEVFNVQAMVAAYERLYASCSTG